MPATAVKTATSVAVKSYRPDYDSLEDRLAFSATIHVDGKRAGTVSNPGRGGANDYSFDSEETEQAFLAYAEEWARTTGADKETSEHADALITFLCEEAELAKKARALARRGAATVIFVEKGPVWFTEGDERVSEEPDFYEDCFLVGIPAGGPAPEIAAAMKDAARWRLIPLG